jgi:undecaprenyl-diphosphatase
MWLGGLAEHETAAMSSTSAPTTRDDSAMENKTGWQRIAVVSVVGWVVLCALIVGWGWLLTHSLHSSIEPTDDRVSRWFVGQRDHTLTQVADAGTLLGETVVGASAFTVISVVVSLFRRTWRPLVLVAIVEAGLGGFYLAGTQIDPRDRPPVKLLDPGLVHDASYPSGHVATAFVLGVGTAVLLWTYAGAVRWVGVLLVLVPVWTLLSRLYLGAHHLTDVLTSFVYAAVWLGLVASVVLPRGSTLHQGK